MAPYFRDPNLDKEDENSPGSVSITSAGDQAADDGAIQGQSGGSNTPTGTGAKFTNIDTYLKGDNAKQFGQEFGGKIQSGINDARSNFDKTAESVKGQINSQGYAPSQDEINSYISRAGDSTTDEDAKKYQGWLSQSYSGPKSLQDNQSAWNEYWGKANDAKAAAKQAGSESGRFALLDKYYGRPNYGFGQKSLDNLLVQAGGGFNNASDLQNQATQLDAYGQNKSDEVRSAASQRAGQIDQSRQAARSAIGLGENNQIQGGALGQFQNELAAKTAGLNNNRHITFDRVLNELKDRNVAGPDLDFLGAVDRKAPIYNLDPTSYLRENNPITSAQAASDSDYAKYLALSKLAGVDPGFLRAGDRAQAGQTDLPVSFDLNRFNSDRAASQGLYMQEASAPQRIEAAGREENLSILDMKRDIENLKAQSGGDDGFNRYISQGGLGPEMARKKLEAIDAFDRRMGAGNNLMGDNTLQSPFLYREAGRRR